MSWTLVNALVVALCTYRLVVLVGQDTITHRLRLWVRGNDPTTRMGQWRVKIHSFLTCPWCLGFYVAIGVVALTHWQWSTVRWGCYVLAISAIVGILEKVVE